MRQRLLKNFPGILLDVADGLRSEDAPNPEDSPQTKRLLLSGDAAGIIWIRKTPRLNYLSSNLPVPYQNEQRSRYRKRRPIIAEADGPLDIIYTHCCSIFFYTFA